MSRSRENSEEPSSKESSEESYGRSGLINLRSRSIAAVFIAWRSTWITPLLHKIEQPVRYGSGSIGNQQRLEMHCALRCGAGAGKKNC